MAGALWSDVKVRIKNKCAFDSDTMIDTSDLTFDHDFCKQAREHLYAFTEKARIIHAMRVKLNTAALTAGIYQIDTLNDSVMPAAYQALIEAEQLWINGREVQCFAMGQPHTETSYTVSQGQPLFYRYVEDYILAFDCPLSDTELDSNDNYVSGWFMHPIITADNNMVKLPFKFIDIFAEYSAAELMRSVVSDDVGLTRLRMYEKRTTQAILDCNARATASAYGA